MKETVTEKVARAAGDVGKGALAGLVGTALMTATSTIEMTLRKRDPSDAPIKAAGRVLGVQPRNPEGAKRFGTYVHWTYGMAWGAVGGLLHFALDEELATAAHFVAVWGAALTILPKLDVAPPPHEWGWQEIGIDFFHHAVYALGVAASFRLLSTKPETGMAKVKRSLRELVAA